MAKMEMQTLWNVGGAQGTQIDEAAKQKIARFIEKRVGEMRCPDHDKAPTIICSGTSLEDVTFEVKGCCQKIIYLVKSKLAE